MSLSKPALAARFGFAARFEDGQVIEWQDARPEPDWAALQLQAEEEDRILSIKAEAGRRIIEQLPDFRQRNLIAETVERLIQVITEQFAAAGVPLSEDQLAHLGEFKPAWDTAKAIRSHSNDLETDPAATAQDPNWPEFQ